MLQYLRTCQGYATGCALVVIFAFTLLAFPMQSRLESRQSSASPGSVAESLLTQTKEGPAAWTLAYATVALFVATLGLFGMAWYQLREMTLQQRNWATLQACDRYDTDPKLGAALIILRRLKEGERTALTNYRIVMAVTTVFNYFDSIAIGLNQGLYIEGIVREHLRTIMQRRKAELDATTHEALNEFKREFEQHFANYIALVERWNH